MPRAVALSLLLVVLLSSSLVRAETPSDPASAGPAEAAPATETKWYGYQMLITDVPFIVGTLATQKAEIALGAVLLGPIVHLGNRHPIRALASLLLRLGLPVVGGVIGVKLDTCDGVDHNFCGEEGLAIGAAFGILAATAIDAGLLARTTVQKTSTLRPALSVGTQGSFQLGLGGSF